jgi:predicted amidohydrolase YtcJ
MSADIILRNARLLRPDGKGWDETADAVAVGGGILLATGTAAELAGLRGNHTEEIDLAGAFLTPGLVDGHAHPLQGHDLQVGVDLSGLASPAVLLDRLREAAAALPPGAWLQGHGLEPAALDGMERHLADLLAEAAGGRPVFLLFFDYHGVAVSRAALAAAGITGARTFESGAQITCDAEGRPTGLLLETEAVELVRAALPRLGEAERLASMRALFLRMAAAGLTGMHVMDANGDSLECLAALEAQGELPLRFHVLPWVNPGATKAELARVLALQGRAGKHWKVCGTKFFIDGTIDAGTAWLHAPDTKGESTAAYWPDPASYSEAVRFFALKGVQTVTHAIGDAAVRHVLDTLESVPAPLRHSARHRVEHIEMLPDEDIGRFAALGVVPSMQPSHAARYASADYADNWSRRLGTERAGLGWRCADIAATGAKLVLGSDWPIAPYDPREILVCARTRRLPGMAAHLAVGPDQRLTPDIALAGLTAHAAHAVREETRLGALVPGMLADLTAFTADPLFAPADELAAAPFRLTMMGGVVTHHSPG